MNYLATIVISALGLTRREQSATDRNSPESAPMQQLSADELRNIAGGAVDGPRGGW